MNRMAWPSLLLLVVGVCACSTVGKRRAEKPAAFAALTPTEQSLVSQGQIERGMDTNAVFIALGKPSAVTSEKATTGPGVDQTWIYYGDRPVLVPGWAYLPNPYGYWSPQYYPEHYSMRVPKMEVDFYNGRVVSWKKFSSVADP